MNVKKLFSPNNPNDISQTASWGTLGLAGLFLFISIYSILAIFSKNMSAAATVGRVFMGLNLVAGIISVILTIRRRQDLGFGLLFIALLAFALESVLLFQGRTIVATVVLLGVMLISYFWLCSPRWKRSSMIAFTITLALMWTVEFLNPSWRILSSAGGVGFGAGILFVGFFVAALFFQATKNSMRARLIYALLIVTIIPLAITAFVNDNSTRTSLTRDSNESLFKAASQTAKQLNSFIENELQAARSDAQSEDIVNYILLPASQRSGSAEEEHVNQFVYARLAENPIYITSVAIYDINGVTLADTVTSDIDVNKSDQPWFQNAISTGLPYASNMEFDEVTGAPSLYFSAPVRDAAGKIIGVIRTRYDAAILQSIFTSQNKLFGKTSFPILIDKQSHMRLAHGTTPSLVYKTVVPPDAAMVKTLQAKQLLPAGTPEKISTNLPRFESALLAYETQPFFTAKLEDQNAAGNERAAVVKTQHQNWLVVYAVSEDEFVAPINRQVINSILITVIAGLLVAAFALFMAQSLAGPIVRLRQTAEAIADGNINVDAIVETTNEIGTLAGTFNRMTQQLRNFINTLESRVAERTRNLELAAEVGRTVSQVRALDVMLIDAAELIRKQFNLYYVQVYLVNPSRTRLDLQAGTGDVGKQLLGRHHNLPFNIDSINGRAAVEKKAVVISNTIANPTFKANPLLPNTRSEMAVPLMVGDRVVGVLDMQSEHSGALSEEALPAFEALAGQLAIAIQNANFLTETEQARAEVEAQARRISRANWTDYLDAIHKPEEIGFVFDQNKVVPLIEDIEPKENALFAPIHIVGEELGSLVVEGQGKSPIARTDELVNAVAQQVARQVEALRLVDSAERYRFEAEEASRRLTREGWKSYATKTEESLRYVYDLNAVLPQEEAQPVDGYALPINVRDEAIGKLVIQSLEADDTTSRNIANAVAERLAIHVESLRQFDETQAALTQSEKLFQASSQLTQATDLQELVAAVVTTLSIPAANRALLTTFQYGPAGDIEQLTIVGNWWNGTGHEVTPIGTIYSRDVMRVMPMFISPTPVFFNDVFHDERVDPITMELIAKRLNLRSVAILPLYSSNKQLGALVLEGEEPHKFTQEEIRLFTSLAPQIATILENRRQYEETQLARAQSEKLFNASRGLTQAANLQELMATAVTTIGIPQVNRALLTTFGYDAEGNITEMTVAANWWNGSGHEPTRVGISYEREVLQNMQIYLSPTPLFTNDAAHDERVDPVTRERAEAQNIRAMAFLPLQVAGRQIGILVLEAEESYNFTGEETRLFSSLAPQIATVLENRRQFEQAQRQAQREAMLNAINQKIQSATSVEAVLQIAARELGSALDASRAVAQLGMKLKIRGYETK